jgi:hypothetical protein
MAIRQENHHIFLSNKEKCREILNKNQRTREDIIDFLISLHLVLETGLNAFYRQIILTQLQKGIEQTKIADNLDTINFIDKTALFFYLPHFNFQGRIDEADRSHAAIGKLRQFSEIRNKLLHGHMDGQITYSEERSVQTRVHELISDETMSRQIEFFKFINEAVSFYFDHLKSSFTPQGKEDIKSFYLSNQFLGV